MANKEYIVANKEQELNVLKKLENNGFKWVNIETLPTKFRFSESFLFNKFPYVISAREDIKRIGWWSYYPDYDEGNVVFDGRKEKKMYKVTQEFMNKLVEWRDKMDIDLNIKNPLTYVSGQDIDELPIEIDDWWNNENNNPLEANLRLIAIIQWLNGEDVFEVEEQQKFVVRNDTPDDSGEYWYVKKSEGMTYIVFYISQATKFDTREQAQEWANSHQVVVEIDEDGNKAD